MMSPRHTDMMSRAVTNDLAHHSDLKPPGGGWGPGRVVSAPRCSRVPSPNLAILSSSAAQRYRQSRGAREVARPVAKSCQGKKLGGDAPTSLNSCSEPCQRRGMTNPHPDQSPTAASSLRRVTLMLVVLMGVLIAVSAAGAWGLWALIRQSLRWYLNDALVRFDAGFSYADGFWYVAGLWCGLVMMLTSTVILAAESWVPRWGWKEGVIEQVRGFCWVLIMVACLSTLAVWESGVLGVTLDGNHPWDWFALVEWPACIIVIAQYVRRIIRARHRMRGDSGLRT
jgi:hypothetical protein